MKSTSQRRVHSRTLGIVVALAFLAAVGGVVVMAPRVLASLAVPERISVKSLLGSALPLDLDFVYPDEHYLKPSETIAPLAEALKGKEAHLLSRGAGSELASGYAYQFDYGYKGTTVRIFPDGRAQIRLGKGEMGRVKSLLGPLWFKFGDREPGNFVYYETEADSGLVALAEAAYKASLKPTSAVPSQPAG